MERLFIGNGKHQMGRIDYLTDGVTWPELSVLYLLLYYMLYSNIVFLMQEHSFRFPDELSRQQR